MATALIFPGQGSQFVGMGRELYEAYPVARQVFEEADELFSGLIDIMFGRTDATSDNLRRTEITQPALYVQAIDAYPKLAETGVAAGMVAGQGVGGDAALAAAEAIYFEGETRAEQRRGGLAANADRARPGTSAGDLRADRQ